MKSALLAIFGIVLLATFSIYAFSADSNCKSYCDVAFSAAKELDAEINGGAREISYAATNVDDDSIRLRVNATYPKYQKAQCTINVARFLYDFTAAFEEAGVTVPGYTYENAAKVATIGVVKLNAVLAELDVIAEDLKKLLNPDKDA